MRYVNYSGVRVPVRVKRAIRRGDKLMLKMWLNSMYGKWPKPSSPEWSKYGKRKGHR